MSLQRWMPNLLFSRGAMCATIVFVVGCGTWLGNPKDPEEEGGGSAGKAMVDLDIGGGQGVNLVATSVPVVGSDGSDIGTFAFEKAMIVLKEIKLSREGEADDGEMDFPGPYIVDLMTNTMNPAAPEAAIEPGFYDRIRLKMHKLKEDDATNVSSDIIDRSVYLSGTYDSGSETKSVAMTFKLSENFDLEDGLNGINLVADAAAQVLIQFNLAKWLDFSDVSLNKDGLDLSDLTGNSIVLSEDSSDDDVKSVHEAIKEAIKASADFGKDLDGDGVLSESDKEEESVN